MPNRSLVIVLFCAACSAPLHDDSKTSADDTQAEPSGETPADTDPSDTGGDSDTDDTPSDTDPADSGAPSSTPTIDCDLIAAANPAWEVCEETTTSCAGVFNDGAGCSAYCAAAGMVCTARYGGESGCIQEADYVIDCLANNDHNSDWCVCGISDEPGTTDDPSCPNDPTDPPRLLEQGHRAATYDRRNNWVLDCYDYAYTAQDAEHRECDDIYDPDGSRRGTATYVFEDVPPGWYRAYMGGRHTENRNAAGARFIVDGHVVHINQRDDSGDRAWDFHGEYCLEGRVEVILDSSVSSGSDSTMGVRFEPVP